MRRPLFYGYWLIAAAFAAQFVAAGMQNYVIGPFLTPMIDELGWTRAEYTLPRTLGQFVAAATGFFIGAWVDRYGARLFMFVGLLTMGAALFLTAWVTEFWHWIVLNGLVLSIGAALLGNLVVNVTLSKWFVAYRGRAIAVAAMGVSLAGVILTPAVTVAIDLWGWRLAWQLMGVVTVVVIVPAAAVMRSRPEVYGLLPDGINADSPKDSTARAVAQADYDRSMTRRQALRTPTFYWLVIAFGLFVITIQVMLLQTVPMLTDAGFSRTTAAAMIAVTSVPSMLSKPVWGWLIDELRPAPLASLSSALTGISLVAIVFSAAAHHEVGLFIGYVLLGIGWGGMIPLQEVIWTSYFGRRYIGAVRSAAMPFSLIFAASAPLATSYYHDVFGDYDGAILTIAAASLCAALMMLVIPKPIDAGRAERA